MTSENWPKDEFIEEKHEQRKCLLIGANLEQVID